MFKWIQVFLIWIVYIVFSVCECIEIIVSKFGIMFEVICSVNQILLCMVLKVGLIILVLKNEEIVVFDIDLILEIVDNVCLVIVLDVLEICCIYVKVGKCDILVGIVSCYCVSVVQIKEWNGLKCDILVVGQSLQLYVFNVVVYVVLVCVVVMYYVVLVCCQVVLVKVLVCKVVLVLVCKVVGKLLMLVLGNGVCK